MEELSTPVEANLDGTVEHSWQLGRRGLSIKDPLGGMELANAVLY